MMVLILGTVQGGTLKTVTLNSRRQLKFPSISSPGSVFRRMNRKKCFLNTNGVDIDLKKKKNIEWQYSAAAQSMAPRLLAECHLIENHLAGCP